MKVFDGNKFKALRKSSGVPVKELLKALGYSEKANSGIYYWQSGKYKPSTEQIKVIARVLGCSVNDLMSSGSGVNDAPVTVQQGQEPIVIPVREQLHIKPGVGVTSRMVPDTGSRLTQPKTIPDTFLDNSRKDNYVHDIIRHLPQLCNEAQVIVVNYILKGV